MKMQRWNPFLSRPLLAPMRPVSALQQDLGQLLDTFFRSAEPFGGMPDAYLPAMDVVENDKEIRIAVDLPGFDEKDLNVSVHKDVLNIRGERKGKHKEDGEDWHMTERYEGRFERSFALPTEVDTEKMSAVFKNGVLNVTMQKAPSARSEARRIAIRSA